MNATFFGRLATPLKPLLDNLYLETMWFFVPNRLTWESWEKFNGAQDNPGDSTDYVVPQVNSFAGWTENSLGDYFGLPTQVPGLDTNVLPLRAYNLIWNEWFRDQNLQNSVVARTTDTGDVPTDYVLLPRGKRHDYFTSCLPWPQKGDPVTVPLGGLAPLTAADGVTPNEPWLVNSQTIPGNYHGMQVNAAPGTVLIGTGLNPGESNLFADLSNATGFTINQLRQSFQIQRLLERDARGGTRYIEVIKAHFGVTSPDARLQRPEYLGGSSTRINVAAIAQTSGTAPADGYTVTPQGNLAAMGTVGSNARFTKSFVEHGFIIGLANIRADLTYQQGLRRMWSRQTRFDHFWPSLSHLGEMTVLNKEIFAQGSDDAVADEDVFGYQEAWGDYRYRPSQVTGTLRSNAAAPLDVWHLAQDFATLPVLGEEFIIDNPPIDRIIAVQDEPHILMDAYFNLRCARPMPLYGVPGLIDHF